MRERIDKLGDKVDPGGSARADLGNRSVIVPVFNEEQGIRATLREPRNSCPFTEIIVVDDGYTDGTGRKGAQLEAGRARCFLSSQPEIRGGDKFRNPQLGPPSWRMLRQRPAAPPGMQIEFVALPTLRPTPTASGRSGGRRQTYSTRGSEIYDRQRFAARRTDLAAGLHTLLRTTLSERLGLEAGTMNINPRSLLRPLFPGSVTE